MTNRSEVQNTGINNSFNSFAFEDYNSQQHPVITRPIKKVSKLSRHHSLQSHSSSRNNSGHKSVVHVILRPAGNSIGPTNNILNDYNAPLQVNIASIQALRPDRQTSINSNVGQDSVLSTQNVSLYTARINQNYGSLTQIFQKEPFAHNTLTNDMYNKHSKIPKISLSRINNNTNTHKDSYHRKQTTNDKDSSGLTNTTSHTNISPSKSQRCAHFHRSEGKVAQSSRRKLAYKDDRQSKNRRRRKYCGSYCCQCSPLCIFLSILALLVVAAAIAALIIALLKPKSVITTVTSTTTTSITTTTSSSTSTTSTSTTSTTTTTTTTTTVTTSSTSSPTSTTTTARPMCPVTQPGDPIHGLYSTTAGGSTVGFEGRYSSSSEDPVKAIDNDLTTKYLNFGANGTFNVMQSQPGAGTGFYVTPTMSNTTVANGLLFATGNDFPERDPLTVTLEGTNSTALNSSSNWTLIYSGASGIDPINSAPNRSSYGTLQVFSNTNAYQSYRLLINSERSLTDSVQYSECHIMTYC